MNRSWKCRYLKGHYFRTYSYMYRITSKRNLTPTLNHGFIIKHINSCYRMDRKPQICTKMRYSVKIHMHLRDMYIQGVRVYPRDLANYACSSHFADKWLDSTSFQSSTHNFFLLYDCRNSFYTVTSYHNVKMYYVPENDFNFACNPSWRSVMNCLY